MELRGYLRNTDRKSGRNIRGAWVKYTAEVHPLDGAPVRVGWPFDVKPKVSEGDYVEMIVNKDGKFNVVDDSSVKRLDPPAASPAARTAGDEAAEKYKERVQEGNFGEFNRKTNPEDAKRMTYSASADRAVAFIDMLLRHDALPISKAQTKPGTAQRYAEISAAVDKKTIEFYNDTLSLRKLQTVADTGMIDTSPSSELPKAGDGDPNGVDD